MTKSIYLALAIHNHQPVGNFDHVFEEAYRAAYLPMIEALERHPSIRLALHYTGPLRDWLMVHKPDFFSRVRALVERGQVEVMTGGYYEPILVALPDADKQGQIRKLTHAVREDFGYEPTGAWLAERVWEPHLAKPMAEAGIEYTIVDDTHFKYVGLEDKDLFGYYVTEEQGVTLKIFGTSKHLRYIIPWGSVEEVIAYLREEADESGRKVAVMGDDGEKFGLWPGTYAHCWGNRPKEAEEPVPAAGAEPGWMERFFTAIEENGDWLHMITPGEYAARFPALGRVYLPTASYDEMTEWALPPELAGQIVHLKHQLQQEGRTDILRFIRGGFWRNFMVKYPEINTLHKKMLWVSRKVHTLAQGKEDEGIHVGVSPDPPRSANGLQESLGVALNHLWAGQCNCPYWHGVFGGIYLFHIRRANFAHLIAAEVIADRIRHGGRPFVEAAITDFDGDAGDEVVLTSDALALVFDPASGGHCVEFDWRARCFNLANTLTRRPEGYHRDLKEAGERGEVVLPGQEATLESIHTTVVRAKEPDLHKQLFYDWYRRALFIDHFLSPETTLMSFAQAQYGENGDFVNNPYRVAVVCNDQVVRLQLARDGHAWMGTEFVPLRVEKTIHLVAGSSDLEVVYRVTNTARQPFSGRFGIETNWAMEGGNGPGAYFALPGQDPVGLNTWGEAQESTTCSLVLEWLPMYLQLAWERPATLWRFPIETISLSEAGFERVYQGLCVMPWWDLALPPDQSWEVTLSIKLRDLGTS